MVIVGGCSPIGSAGTAVQTVMRVVLDDCKRLLTKYLCTYIHACVTKGCRFNSKDLLLAIELFYWKATWAALPGGVFLLTGKFSDVVFWNKNAILKFREIFRIASSIDILNGAEIDMNLTVCFRPTPNKITYIKGLSFNAGSVFFISLKPFRLTCFDTRHQGDLS